MKTLMIAACLVGGTAYAGPDFLEHAPATCGERALALTTSAPEVLPADDIAFAPEGSALDPNAIVEIDAAAHWLTAHPAYKLVLEAHTARVRSPDYAEKLATRRAQAVREHLMSWGIASDRIVLLVAGEHAPGPRVEMFVSAQPTRQIVKAALDLGHVRTAVWTDRGTLFRTERGLTASR